MKTFPDNPLISNGRTLQNNLNPRRRGNGLEAVAAYRAGAFDLVLMDFHMPEMDGAEATRAIRQIEAFEGRRTPIVALTADVMDENRQRSLAAGMDDQVVKPLTIAVLTSHIRAWLSAA